jgi:hypothetical protein
MVLKENFLSHEQCDSIIEFYKNNQDKAFELAGLSHIQLFNKKNQDKTFELEGAFTIELFNYPEFAPLLNKIDAQIREDFTGDMHIDNCEIVKWPIESFKRDHVDTGDKCVFLCYLNDDYTGGETVIENENFTPKKGSMIYFNNGNLSHRVNPVGENDRYILAGWYV